MNDVKIPKHVGIIMDGNRRWAKEKGKKSIDGHLAGANRIMDLAKYVFKKGVDYLSIYAFSTENFGRSEEEVTYLMGLLMKDLRNLMKIILRLFFQVRRSLYLIKFMLV